MLLSLYSALPQNKYGKAKKKKRKERKMVGFRIFWMWKWQICWLKDWMQKITINAYFIFMNVSYRFWQLICNVWAGQEIKSCTTALKENTKVLTSRVPWWFSRLRIWCCQCCGSSSCWTWVQFLALEIPHAAGGCQKIKNKRHTPWTFIVIFFFFFFSSWLHGSSLWFF